MKLYKISNKVPKCFDEGEKKRLFNKTSQSKVLHTIIRQIKFNILLQHI